MLGSRLPDVASGALMNTITSHTVQTDAEAAALHAPPHWHTELRRVIDEMRYCVNAMAARRMDSWQTITAGRLVAALERAVVDLELLLTPDRSAEQPNSQHVEGLLRDLAALSDQL